MPDIPDCIESADEAVEVFELDDMWQGLPGSRLGRPERQGPRGVCAGRQTRDSKERRARERDERRRRRAAGRTSGDDDPAAAEQDHRHRLDEATGQESTCSKSAGGCAVSLGCLLTVLTDYFDDHIRSNYTILYVVLSHMYLDCCVRPHM